MQSKRGKDNVGLLKRSIIDSVRPTIVKEILLGYLALTMLIIIISSYAIFSLKELNEMNRSIVQEDVQTIEAMEKLFDTLFEQELYARRHLILNNSEMLSLFWERSDEFDRIITGILESGKYSEAMGRLRSLHNKYNELFVKDDAVDMDKLDKTIRKKQDELVTIIRGVSSHAGLNQQEKILLTERLGSTAFQVAVILGGAGIILSVFASFFITRNISRSINRLKHATEEISEGKFESSSNIEDINELGELTPAFIEMARRIKQTEEMSLDASPLTRLPGGVAVEHAMNRRLVEMSPAAYCFIDLDNFKAFNDRYSYARGNEVIKATARIIEGSIARSGKESDFIGHIGGDDFVFITGIDRCHTICKGIIDTFDEMIKAYYAVDDVRRGFIVSKNRQGQDMQFPIMSISIAVITSRYHHLSNPVQIGEIAAELKEYAKSVPGSIFVVDRRQSDPQPGKRESASPFPQSSV